MPGQAVAGWNAEFDGTAACGTKIDGRVHGEYRVDVLIKVPRIWRLGQAASVKRY